MPGFNGDLVGRVVQYSCRAKVNPTSKAWTMRLYTGIMLSVTPHELVSTVAATAAAKSTKGGKRGKKREGEREGGSGSRATKEVLAICAREVELPERDTRMATSIQCFLIQN
jgi:hypothetical protein